MHCTDYQPSVYHISLHLLVRLGICLIYPLMSTHGNLNEQNSEWMPELMDE